MSKLEEYLQQEKRNLINVLEKCNQDLNHDPKMTLRILKKGKIKQYYVRERGEKSKSHNGKYLKKSEETIVNQIVQYDYASKIQNLANKRLGLVELLLNNLKKQDLGAVYDELSEERKQLLIPYILPDKEYAIKWQTQEYDRWEKYEENLSFQTNRGEVVRSKSEKILADKFERMGVPYLYEKPLRLASGIIVHPDFTILNVKERKEIYWEHLGLMDQEEYCQKAIQKINTYQNNGIIMGKDLIVTMETKKNLFDVKIVEILLKEYIL